jgi:hypothetical protein
MCVQSEWVIWRPQNRRRVGLLWLPEMTMQKSSGLAEIANFFRDLPVGLEAWKSVGCGTPSRLVAAFASTTSCCLAVIMLGHGSASIVIRQCASYT